MARWQKMENAPRDGAEVMLWAECLAYPVKMRWDPEGTNPLLPDVKGLWRNSDATWTEAHGDGPEKWAWPYEMPSDRDCLEVALPIQQSKEE